MKMTVNHKSPHHGGLRASVVGGVECVDFDVGQVTADDAQRLGIKIVGSCTEIIHKAQGSAATAHKHIAARSVDGNRFAT